MFSAIHVGTEVQSTLTLCKETIPYLWPLSVSVISAECCCCACLRGFLWGVRGPLRGMGIGLCLLRLGPALSPREPLSDTSRRSQTLRVGNSLLMVRVDRPGGGTLTPRLSKNRDIAGLTSHESTTKIDFYKVFTQSRKHAVIFDAVQEVVYPIPLML